MQDVAAAFSDLSIPVPFAIAVAISTGLILAMMIWLLQSRRTSRSVSGTHSLIGTGGAEQSLPPQKPVAQFRDEATIVAEISVAKTSGNDAELAPLRLENGRRFAFQEDDRKATDEFIQAVVLAKGSELPEIHAAARLELASLSEARGDLTTACEHWQIARMIYHELDRQEDVDRTDANMLRNQCPTDWVLTDF